MPKELTHWHIAAQTLEQVAPGIAEYIHPWRDLYYLGAVAHDIAFYDLSRPAEKSLEWVGDCLHGVHGENTLEPLIQMLSKALHQPQPRPMVCFILGMLTHYAADSTFHPFVYYMSGNYFADDVQKRTKAVYRHRLLETAIDSWLETKEPGVGPKRLAALWQDCGQNGPRALQLLSEHFSVASGQDLNRLMAGALRNHRLLQRAFGWTVPYYLLKYFRHLGMEKLAVFEALFYAQPFNLAIGTEPFSWRHPVTGVEKEETIEAIYRQSIAGTAGIFAALAPHEDQQWPVILEGLQPLSLDTGRSDSPVSAVKFFREEPIEAYLLTPKI